MRWVSLHLQRQVSSACCVSENSEVLKLVEFFNELIKMKMLTFFQTDMQIIRYRLYSTKTYKHVHYSQLNPSLSEHILK